MSWIHCCMQQKCRKGYCIATIDKVCFTPRRALAHEAVIQYNQMMHRAKLKRFQLCLRSLSTSRPGLAHRTSLVREFIHESLYDRMIGYFEKHVNILRTNSASYFDFKAMKDEHDYMKAVRGVYREQIHLHGNSAQRPILSAGTEQNVTVGIDRDLHQLWHTPSTIFRPHYGRGIGECIFHRWNQQTPLVIYEIGPGNGSLCEDIISMLVEKHPRVMDSLEYHLIEISSYQSENLLSKLREKYPEQIRIHNKSFLDWKQVESRNAFVIALEVFDNLPHDLIRIDHSTNVIEQGMVFSEQVEVEDVLGNASSTDDIKTGVLRWRHTEHFIPATDNVINELVRHMDACGHEWYLKKGKNSIWQAFLNSWMLNFLQSTEQKEFIPTCAFLFIKKLIEYFPKHCFIMSDFDYLPPTVSAYNGPVVQTRYKGKTVESSSYLLQKGMCDIFFPTDFLLLVGIYKRLCANRKGKNDVDALVLKHREFCERYVGFDVTRTLSGYNPILEDFSNVSFMIAANNFDPKEEPLYYSDTTV